ncbi:unnamed protein product [Aphanomyces euteiches]
MHVGKRGCICPVSTNLPSGTFSAKTTRFSTKTTLPEIAVKDKPKTAKQPKKVVKASLTKEAPAPAMPSVKPATPEPQIQTPPSQDLNNNGNVIVRYNHYKKEFAIKNGSLDAATIDGQYFLSAVFPKSKLYLSRFGPSDFSFESEGLSERPMVAEEPCGIYQGLIVGETYWVHIEEDAEERVAYEKRQDEYSAARAKDRAAKDDKPNIMREKVESCSCIEGNPCVDKYCCKDWDNRYAVAKKHGWKGFQ